MHTRNFIHAPSASSSLNFGVRTVGKSACDQQLPELTGPILRLEETLGCHYIERAASNSNSMELGVVAVFVSRRDAHYGSPPSTLTIPMTGN